MKVVKKETIEKVIEGEIIRIEGLKLGWKTYSLNVSNEFVDRISLQFNLPKNPTFGDCCEYLIRITEEGIDFRRFVHRPNHEHNDIENLYVITNQKPDEGKHKNGDLVWDSNSHHNYDGYKIFIIPFGAIKVEDDIRVKY